MEYIVAVTGVSEEFGAFHEVARLKMEGKPTFMEVVGMMPLYVVESVVSSCTFTALNNPR